MPCSHRVCQVVPKGVAVCIVDPDRKRVLLGLERFGKYKGKYNVCAGSVEPEDDGCALNAALRELREEFKLCFADADVDAHFAVGRQAALRTVMVGPTPVFVGHFDSQRLDAAHLTARMRGDIDDAGLPGTMKEMACAQWFSWDDEPSMAWSRLTRAAMKKVAGQRSSWPHFRKFS